MPSAQYRPRFVKDIRIKPDVETKPRLRVCTHPGCTDEATCNVTKSSKNLSERIWLCLPHAREHNEHWDFFEGMSEEEILRFRIDAITGHRPTWRLDKRTARAPNPYGTFDVDSVFGDIEEEEAPKPRRPVHSVTGPIRNALDVMGLGETATLQEIKSRYKELVKRFHPDANGGDRGAEERLKQVIKAYGVLRASGLT
jgi:DnaJ-domain-containing protein 1